MSRHCAENTGTQITERITEVFYETNHQFESQMGIFEREQGASKDVPEKLGVCKPAAYVECD